VTLAAAWIRGLALLAAVPTNGDELALPPLVFQDYRGKSVSVGAEEAGSAPRLIVASDRAASRFSRRWLARLSSDPGVRIVEVAHITGVPALVRPLVRRAFRGTPVLLDWKGALASRYGFEPARVNLYLIDASGRLLLAESGGDSDADLARVVARI
jgi:hypothetical protein